MYDSIAVCLKAEVEAFAQRLEDDHALMASIATGSLMPGTIARYLCGIHYLLQHSEPHLREAAGIAQQEGDEILADYLTTKASQESGHDRWAESDLSRVNELFGVRVTEVPPSMLEMVKYVEAVVRTKPRHYVGYVFFAEYFTVLMGPKWVGLLETKCGIPQSALTAITNHVELDKLHVGLAMKELDGVLRCQGEVDEIVRTLRGAMQCFERFFDELYEHECAEVAPLSQRLAAG